MAVPTIRLLNDLLGTYLGHAKAIIDLESRRLTATGENYGSQMLALKVRVKSKDEEEVLEVVAKIPPPGEFIRRMFNVPVTFRNEVDFYKIIIPELEQFLQERGCRGYLDCFPEVLGTRLSLQEEKDEVDDDAVILLENLIVKGYRMVDRTVGFDYETSKIVIKALAKYHLVPLALKSLKPDYFRKKIRSLFAPYKVFDLDDATLDLAFKNTEKMLSGIESCKPYVRRVDTALRNTPPPLKGDPEKIREPFATIIHTDTWVNNFMLKYQDGVPTSCKIVDFQLGEYGSPARDVIFLIFTSVQMPVVEEHYDDLMDLYLETLVEGLKKLGCDASAFTREAFQKEVELEVKESEFCHCIMMLGPIFATKDIIKELDEYTEEDMSKEVPIPPKMREKAEFLVHQFVKKNWI